MECKDCGLKNDVSGIKHSIEKINENLHRHEIIAERNSLDLHHHIRRTDILQDSFSLLEKRNYQLSNKLFLMIGIITVLQILIPIIFRFLN